jgi:hypothetical protein
MGGVKLGKGKRREKGACPSDSACDPPCMTKVRHPRPPQLHHLGRGLGEG